MLLRHSAFYLFARGVPALVNFAALALYTRLLAANEFGRYALVLAAIGFSDVIIFQWLRLVLTRYLPAHRDDLDRFLGGMLALFLLLALTVTGAGALLAWFWPDRVWQRLVALAVALLLAQAWLELNLTLATASLAPERYGRLLMSKAGLALAIGGWLAWIGLGAYAPLTGLLAGNAIVAMVFGMAAWRGIRARWAPTEEIRRHLRYGLPLTATFALGWIVSASDRFLVAWLMNEAAVGNYAVGYDLAQQSVGVLLAIVNTAAYPLAVHALEQQGPLGARAQLEQNGSLIIAIALAGAAGLIVLAPGILQLLVGAEFRSGTSTVLPWIAAAAAVAGIKAFHLDIAFHLAAKSKYLILVTAVAAATNIVLNLLLIPTFGILGAAWATLAAYTAAATSSAWLGRRIFSMPPLRPLLLKGCAVAVGAMLGAHFGMLLFQTSVALSLLSGLISGATCAAATAVLVNVAKLRTSLQRRLVGSGQ